MPTEEAIPQKVEQLKGMIDEISTESFRIQAMADMLKSKLQNRAENVIGLVTDGAPNSLNAAIFILTWRIQRPLDSNKRLSWIKIPLPKILRLTDDIISDIESLFTNTPPIAVIKVDGVEVGQYHIAPVNKSLTFDATASWDEDGEIVSYEWDFGDGTPIATQTTVPHVYEVKGTYRIILTVTDNGSPAETATDWVELAVL
ncbi:MAG: PKD domain-containing protein [Candidatus Helarchaeota archaeon]|nr:PKD domain-containing protein [Candidatus Helarchaeota archaeon]